MSGRDKKDEEFVEALTADLAGAVLEDDAALADEIEEIGPELDGMIARTQELAQGAIGRRRRELLRSPGARSPRQVVSRGRYDGLSRAELVEMLSQRERDHGEGAAVQHRELRDMTDADLRSLLEDWDDAEAEEPGDS